MDLLSLRRLLVGAAVLLAATGCARLGGEAFQPTHNALLQLSADVPVGQTFTSPSSAVVGVDLLIATFSAAPDPEGTLRVVLLEEVGGGELDVVEVGAETLRDNAWVPVRFDGPQPAEGRPAIEATWDGGSPLAVRANTPPDPGDRDVLVNDPYPLGELVIDGELAPGDLAFRVLGADGVSALPRTLRGLAAGAARGLAASPLFAALWVALLAGACALAVVGFRRGRAAAGSDRVSG